MYQYRAFNKLRRTLRCHSIIHPADRNRPLCLLMVMSRSVVITRKENCPSLISLDIPNPFFEQENDIDFLEDVRVLSDKSGPIYRRVSTIFGDSKPEGRYSEPEKIADDTLMNVSHFYSAFSS